MKLGETVPQMQLLDALSKASGKHISIILDMLAKGETHREYVEFTSEGMLPQRRYADVTLTRRVSPDRWIGQMGCGPNRANKFDVAVVRNHFSIDRAENGKIFTISEWQNNAWRRVFDVNAV